MAENDTPTSVLSATELVLRYGVQTVLDHATLSINEGDRVGLVGRNGAGKSSFLRIAAGDIDPDEGMVTRRRELVTGYLPQTFSLNDAATVHDNILDGARKVMDLIAEYESAHATSARSSELLERIDHFDGWTIENRIKALIMNLHAPDPTRLAGSLSGGEKRRVALCRALLAQPDLLILDEPTNHLDTESIEWLERFLETYPGACLFVTHDRYFLDRVATRIVEVARGNFISYAGTYSDYLIARAERQSVEEGQEHRRQRFLKRELEWVRRKPSARRTKSVDRVERYFTMASQEAPEQELDVEMIIPPAPKLANRVISLRGVTCELGDRKLVDNLSLEVPAGARIGIVGRNGLGKTSLLRMILGELAPTSGEVEIGSRTLINYVDQGRLLLDEEKTIWDEVGGGQEFVRMGDENISLRAYLRRFLFSEDRVNTKIRLLSGGERSRVILAKILRRGGNVLILDEPTNDLDLATLRLLEEAIVLFAGSVLVVSHDRWFLNRICTHILAFQGGGRTLFDAGDYDTYLAKWAGRAPAAKEAPKPAALAPSPAPRKEKTRKLTWKETKELESIEATIQKAEVEAERLEAIFVDPEFHLKYAKDALAFQAQLQTAKDRVAALYKRWEELEALKREEAAV